MTKEQLRLVNIQVQLFNWHGYNNKGLVHKNVHTELVTKYQKINNVNQLQEKKRGVNNLLNFASPSPDPAHTGYSYLSGHKTRSNNNNSEWFASKPKEEFQSSRKNTVLMTDESQRSWWFADFVLTGLSSQTIISPTQ